jgi:hypothetical protein
MTTAPAIDEEKLMAFVGKVVGEVGAAAQAALVVIGDKLGLYRALATGGPLTSAELAARTGTNERSTIRRPHASACRRSTRSR